MTGHMRMETPRTRQHVPTRTLLTRMGTMILRPVPCTDCLPPLSAVRLTQALCVRRLPEVQPMCSRARATLCQDRQTRLPPLLPPNARAPRPLGPRRTSHPAADRPSAWAPKVQRCSVLQSAIMHRLAGQIPHTSNVRPVDAAPLSVRTSSTGVLLGGAQGCHPSTVRPTLAGTILLVIWLMNGKEYEGLAIVVENHPDDRPEVFRAVPLIDDGRESRKKGLHCIPIAQKVECDDKDWKVAHFGSYRELLITILKMGKEHSRRCGTTVKATVPIPPISGCQHVFAVLIFEKRGLLEGMDLVDAVTQRPIRDKKLKYQKAVKDYLGKQAWLPWPAQLHKYLPPCEPGHEPWFGGWAIGTPDRSQTNPDGMVDEWRSENAADGWGRQQQSEAEEQLPDAEVGVDGPVRPLSPSSLEAGGSAFAQSPPRRTSPSARPALGISRTPSPAACVEGARHTPLASSTVPQPSAASTPPQRSAPLAPERSEPADAELSASRRRRRPEDRSEVQGEEEGEQRDADIAELDVSEHQLRLAQDWVAELRDHHAAADGEFRDLVKGMSKLCDGESAPGLLYSQFEDVSRRANRKLEVASSMYAVRQAAEDVAARMRQALDAEEKAQHCRKLVQTAHDAEYNELREEAIELTRRLPGSVGVGMQAVLDNLHAVWAAGPDNAQLAELVASEERAKEALIAAELNLLTVMKQLNYSAAASCAKQSLIVAERNFFRVMGEHRTRCANEWERRVHRRKA